MNRLRRFLRPWTRHPWQSLFQWLSLTIALGLAGLLTQVLIYGHLALPPGITPLIGYYSLGGSNTRGDLTPLSLLQVQTLIREQKNLLGQYSLYAEMDIDLHIGQVPKRNYKIALLNNDFYGLLGLKPAVGRLFSPNPGQAAQETMISYPLWESLGRPPLRDLRIRLDNRREWTVSGVLPQGFSGFGVHAVDLWLPDHLLPEKLLQLLLDPAIPAELQELTLRFARRLPYFHILGIQEDTEKRSQLEQRLKTLDLSMPPLTTDQGPVITSGIVEAHGATTAPGLNLAPQLWDKTRRYTRLLQIIAINLMILTLVSLVLFLLEQLPERMNEFRLRYIYGAGTAALVWQIFKENLGFVISTLPLAWLIGWLLFYPLAETPPFGHFIPDRLPPPGPALLLWGLLAAFVLASVLALLPLWGIRLRLNPSTTAATVDRKENRLLLSLNTLQTLVAILALVMTLLFILNLVQNSKLQGRTSTRVQLLTLGCKANKPNCNPATLLSLDENLLLSRLNAPQDRAGLGESLFGPMLGQKDLHLKPLMKTSGGATRIDVAAAHFSRGWLQAMKTPLVAGRWPELQGEVLVNNAFLLNQGLTTKSAIGRKYQRDGSPHLNYTITGVLEDLPLEDPRKSPLPRMFFTIPSAIAKMPRNEIVWRDPPNPATLKPRLRKVLDELGLEELQIRQESLVQRIARRLQGERNFAWLLAWSALFSLLLAVTGLYASTRQALSRQRKRVGIVLAYGAQPGQAAAFLYQERGWVLILAVLLALFTLGLLQPALNPWLLAARKELPILLLASLIGVVLATGLAIGLALRHLWHSQPMELIRDQP